MALTSGRMMGENPQRFFSSPGALVGVRIFSAREWRSDIFFVRNQNISKIRSLESNIPRDIYSCCWELFLAETLFVKKKLQNIIFPCEMTNSEKRNSIEIIPKLLQKLPLKTKWEEEQERKRTNWKFRFDKTVREGVNPRPRWPSLAPGDACTSLRVLGLSRKNRFHEPPVERRTKALPFPRLMVSLKLGF